MAYLFAFEKLQVWHDGRQLIKLVYKTTRAFPGEEKYGLVGQMRRAAISIVSNLAEGSGRLSPKDQAHFFQISYSSNIELLNQAIVANDLEFLSDESLASLRYQMEKISNKINALRKACLKNG